MPVMNSEEEKKFSVVKRMKSFSHAGRGLAVFIKTTHNSWVQLVIFAAVIVLGFYFGISLTEWIVVVLAAGMVFMAEAFNTAIEIDVDLTSPDFHPYAKDTKDVAAAAVLIASIAAAIVGVMIFYPHFVTKI